MVSPHTLESALGEVRAVYELMLESMAVLQAIEHKSC